MNLGLFNAPEHKHKHKQRPRTGCVNCPHSRDDHLDGEGECNQCSCISVRAKDFGAASPRAAEIGKATVLHVAEPTAAPGWGPGGRDGAPTAPASSPVGPGPGSSDAAPATIASAAPDLSPARAGAVDPLVMGTPAWRAKRREYIGASEIPIIVGCTSYATVIDLYARKVAAVDLDESQEPHLEHGRDFEPIIAGYYAREVDGPVFGDGRTTFIHPKDPIFGASPDRFLGGDLLSRELERYVQIKGVGWYAGGEWGHPGTDAVPDGYRAQVTQEMAVGNAVREEHGLPPVLLCDVVRFMWGRPLAIYTVAFNAETWELLRGLGRRFMDEHVRAGKAPAMDGSEGSWRYLQATFAKANGRLRQATAEETALVLRYEEARERLKAADEEKALVAQQICERIGEDRGLQGDGWKFTWRPQGPARVKAFTRPAGRVCDFRRQHQKGG